MPELKAAVVPVTPFQQNCTILWEEPDKRALVIDPGGEVPRILEAIRKLGVAPERILLTHGHIDHAGGAAELKEALAAADGAASVPIAPGSPATVPIEGPDPRDQFLLEGLEAQAARFGMTGVRNVLPDRWLAEGDEIRLGAQTFAVLHCPGHTPGHLVFVNREKRFALVGDVLFRGSVGRTDFPYGDHDALIRAIRQKLLPLGDDFSFICGHGPGSTLGTERRSNPFLRG
jgi:glyoxylase-like metal-dependent hydrolase (beta-lactamase superfamily II)